MWLFIEAIGRIGVSVTVLVTGILPVLTRLLLIPIAREKPFKRAF